MALAASSFVINPFSIAHLTKIIPWRQPTQIDPIFYNMTWRVQMRAGMRTKADFRNGRAMRFDSLETTDFNRRITRIRQCRAGKRIR